MVGADWAEAFLEMMAVERAAARNTLTAYGKDLLDAGAQHIEGDVPYAALLGRLLQGETAAGRNLGRAEVGVGHGETRLGVQRGEGS